MKHRQTNRWEIQQKIKDREDCVETPDIHLVTFIQRR